jgi:transposase
MFAESVCDLLRAIAAAARPGVPITLFLDNARYQTCAGVRELAAQLGIELLHLPSYSPNLNLIERVWKFVKKECLRAKYHETYEAFTSSIDQCLAELPTTHKKAMDTLLTHKFQVLDKMPLLAA